jgi:hypothetical protein
MMTMRFLIWNVRSITSQGTQTSLRNLLRQHTPVLLGILEPKKDPSQLDHFRTSLGFSGAQCGALDHIWLFWNSDIAPSVQTVSSFDQAITLSFTHPMFPNALWLSVVYAKCKYRDREPLWTYLRETHASLPPDMAWGVVGDFNCLLDPSEKKGGRPYAQMKYKPFQDCVEDCELMDSPYTGPDYTWNNCRDGEVDTWRKIWSRIDRLLFNQQWMDTFCSPSRGRRLLRSCAVAG